MGGLNGTVLSELARLDATHLALLVALVALLVVGQTLWLLLRRRRKKRTWDTGRGRRNSRRAGGEV